MGRRRKARELLIQAIYAAEVGGISFSKAVTDQIERRKPSPEILDYVRGIARVLDEKWEDLDSAIDQALIGWSPERVGVVERAILRLSLAELQPHLMNPPRAVMNEAVELAKVFSTEDAARFINGILDRLCREMDDPAGK